MLLAQGLLRQLKCWPGLQLSEGRTRVGDCFEAQSCCCWEEASVPCHLGLSFELLEDQHDMAAAPTLPSRMSDPK